MTLAEIRKNLEDLFTPNPNIYWSDFLLSSFVAYAAFYATERFDSFSFGQIFFFFLSSFSLYRAALFIHEITHQERKDLPYFSVAYNLMIGIPALFPSFMYRGVHIDHHKRSTYGTEEDGEYLSFGASSPGKILGYLAQSLYIPFLLPLRFGVLTPLSYLNPSLRKLVLESASSLAINFQAKRKIPEGLEMRHLVIQEILCFVWIWFVVALFYTGTLETHTAMHMYLTLTFVLTINALRTLAAHRYKNKSGELNFQEQLLDSVNIEGNQLFHGLMAPVGLRYHGLHHLYPTMPYHSLQEAHERLKKILPKDSFYFQTIEPSLLSALRRLWNNAKLTEAKDAPKVLVASQAALESDSETKTEHV